MNRLLLLSAGIAGVLLVPSIASAQHHGTCDPDAPLQPLLSVGDVDGDGTVTNADKAIVTAAKDSGQYVAFFDLNADEVLDGLDVAAVATHKGESSTALDRQLAELFWATEAFRNKANAEAVGYRPFTQQLHGHGQHYSKLPFMIDPSTGGLDANYENVLDGNLDVAVPEGLNYDPDGNLVAVFYYHGIDVKSWVFTPAGTPAWYGLFNQSLAYGISSASSNGMYPHLYDSHEALWHQHWGGCWDNLNYPAMTFDTSIVPNFNQHMFPQECAARGNGVVRQGWIPAFNMLHVWLYKLNPCGTFGGTHPDVSVDYEDEPHARPLHHWFMALGIPYPYPDHEE